jgi:hypothetical protein
MTTQTLIVGKRRFVLLSERDFLKLQSAAHSPKRKPAKVHTEFAEDAKRQLDAYRRTGKAADWKDVRAKLGI